MILPRTECERELNFQIVKFLLIYTTLYCIVVYDYHIFVQTK